MTRTVTVTAVEEVKLDKIRVVRTNSRDVDSTNLSIYYGNVEIGHGHLNSRTNFAHITLGEYYCDELEDYLIEGIENRTIDLY